MNCHPLQTLMMAPTLGTILQILLLSVVSLLAKNMRPQLVVIMLDGMRWDYLDLLPKKDLGGFAYFMEKGVRTEYVETVFPSTSLPAWTTLLTGLFPENHNILGNRMYDRSTKLEMNASTHHLPMWWKNAEPIWITATRQGLRAVTINWKFAELPFAGWLPEEATDVIFSDYIQEVIWRLLRDFDLILMYDSTIDDLGHIYGPASKPVMTELCRVGRAIDRLFRYIHNNRKEERVHVSVVSDHGMTSSCMVPRFYFNHYIDEMTEYIFVIDGVIFIYSKTGCLEELYRWLRSMPGYITKMHDDIPEEFHFKGGDRAPDVLLYKDPQWRPPRRRCLEEPRGGTHGGDPLRDPTTRGVFMAWGAAFIGDGLVHPPLRLVDIYQLYAHVLRFTPRPHNGSWSAVRRLLRCGSSGPMASADDCLQSGVDRLLLETRLDGYLWRSYNSLLLVSLLLTFSVTFIFTSYVIIPQAVSAECQRAGVLLAYEEGGAPAVAAGGLGGAQRGCGCAGEGRRGRGGGALLIIISLLIIQQGVLLIYNHIPVNDIHF